MSEMYNGTAKIPPEKFEFVHSGERIAEEFTAIVDRYVARTYQRKLAK